MSHHSAVSASCFELVLESHSLLYAVAFVHKFLLELQSRSDVTCHCIYQCDPPLRFDVVHTKVAIVAQWQRRRCSHFPAAGQSAHAVWHGFWLCFRLSYKQRLISSMSEKQRAWSQITTASAPLLSPSTCPLSLCPQSLSIFRCSRDAAAKKTYWDQVSIWSKGESIPHMWCLRSRTNMNRFFMYVWCDRKVSFCRCVCVWCLARGC